jgi:hypothetical protein
MCQWFNKYVGILDDSKEILVTARLFLYGQELNTEIGEKIVDEINAM